MTYADMSALEQLEGIKAKEIDARELWDYYRQRCLDDQYNALVWIEESRAPKIKEDAPLGGIPLAVKDIFTTEGKATRACSKILESFQPTYTATVVEKLTEAGAPMLCKTNMDEFAMGGSNENSAYGSCKNPVDTSRVPGGSSGGSAAAVRAGLAPWAIGTDTGGSVRQPASFCGVVGLKPTYGACSRYGMIAFASSLDCAGPITKTVSDAQLLFAYMVGKDEKDMTSRDYPGLNFCERDDLRGTRFGVVKELIDELDGDVSEAFAKTVAKITSLGAEVDEVSLPNVRYGVSAYYILSSAEASSNLSRYDGLRFGKRIDADSLLEMYQKTRDHYLGNEVKRRIMLGTYALSAGYYDAYYNKAREVRGLIAEDYKKAFDSVDFLLSPTAPTSAYPLDSAKDPWQMYLGDVCTVPASLAGLPALSLPMETDNLPIGLQITGREFSESEIFSAAKVIEQ
jgi:aspartyl-tRNA(Asn)/glutamyl-tRNA(Gln) amidotransferase subunit A